jgi:hypothetical protein
LPRNIFFLGLIFNDFSSEMVFSVFPAFFTSVLKAEAASLGFVDGIALKDHRISSRSIPGISPINCKAGSRLSLPGYVLSVLTRPFYILFSTVGRRALGLRVLDRIGKGIRDAPRDAIISLSTPKEELGRSFRLSSARWIRKSILGPLAAYLILRFFPLHFNAVFLTAFVEGLIDPDPIFHFGCRVPRSPRQRTVRITSSFKNPSWAVQIIYPLHFCIVGGQSLPISVMLLKTKSIGLIIADIPLFYMVYNLPYAGFVDNCRKNE